MHQNPLPSRWLRTHRFCLAVCCVLLLGGCLRSSPHEVVVYSALDGEFSGPILREFQQERGCVVRSNFDVESTKTVGLVTRIIREQRRPRCDVFWNNEILHTLRLEKLGLLDAYVSPAAQSFPANYRSAEGYWYGLAARARVLIVNTDLVPEDQRPDSLQDLIDPKWKGRVGIAKPLFGTTATHASVLFSLWGSERAKEFFGQLKRNARVMSGNKQVALSVARGELAFGLTDTDDAIIELEGGSRWPWSIRTRVRGRWGRCSSPTHSASSKGVPIPKPHASWLSICSAPTLSGSLLGGQVLSFPSARMLRKGRARRRTSRCGGSMSIFAPPPSSGSRRRCF